MHPQTTDPKPTTHQRSDQSIEATATVPLAPRPVPAENHPLPLATAAEAIRRDALQDPVAYLIRSDTQQHGE